MTATRDDETPLPQGLAPVLCCDRWEHAYFLQYKGQADRYQEAWWQLVDWKKAPVLVPGPALQGGIEAGGAVLLAAAVVEQHRLQVQHRLQFVKAVVQGVQLEGIVSIHRVRSFRGGFFVWSGCWPRTRSTRTGAAPRN